MLWESYVFRRGADVFELWDDMFPGREARLLYIAGAGFDLRVIAVLEHFLAARQAGAWKMPQATLALVGFSGYELSEDLKAQTAENERTMREMFAAVGDVTEISFGMVTGNESGSINNALRDGTRELLALVDGYTDIIVDVSTLPRVVYLTVLTGLLSRLVPANDPKALSGPVNLQVLVAEDSKLDSRIRAEDPGESIVLIPGFGGTVLADSVEDWPMVWLPLLGEHRASHLEAIATRANIPASAEICPILPHPSRDPRRADRLIVEYDEMLFRSGRTPLTNIVYAHESRPFEAYRQILGAMQRYRQSLRELGGSRQLITPLGSKLMTIAAGLAAFEMRPIASDRLFALGIPYAAPTRYVVEQGGLKGDADLSALLLTGEPYRV